MPASTEGDRAVRGGLLRVTGYGVGLLATGLSSLVLLRHLGVVDFGRFVTVTALVAIIGGLSDAGLTVIGQRGYPEAADPARRRSFLAVLLGLRLAITPPAVALATAFAVAAGYDTTMIAGAAIAGAGLVFSNRNDPRHTRGHGAADGPTYRGRGHPPARDRARPDAHVRGHRTVAAVPDVER